VKTLRILVADDHGLVRCGATAVLQTQRGWKVVGEAANGLEAVQKAIELQPDVAILDISMPGLDGIEAARQIHGVVPDTKLLVVSMHESDQMVRRALDAGVLGYLLKSDFTDSLTKAVKAVAEGKRFLTPKVSEIVLDGFLRTSSQYQQWDRPDTRTTPREIEIIRLLAGGKANKEIATLLGITVRTVETHRAKIMLKLGIHSLADLIHYALRNELISVNGAW
jgi:DNA-binding NarL/FixJ family response regulator